MIVSRLTYLTIASGAALWCSCLVLAPLLVTGSSAFQSVGAFLYQFFHGICHQIDAHSFHVFGKPLAVCSRCSAIYFAFLAGTIFYPAIRKIGQIDFPPRSVLVVSVLPMLLEVLAGYLGVHDVTNLSRAVTGAIFGGVLPFFVIPIATEAFSQFLFSSQRETNTHFQRDLPNV